MRVVRFSKHIIVVEIGHVRTARFHGRLSCGASGHIRSHAIRSPRLIWTGAASASVRRILHNE